MSPEKYNAMQCNGFGDRRFFSNVFPKNLEKLQNIPRRPTY